MRLKDGFILYDTEDTHILVPIGGQSFKGIVRSNDTAAFILNLLKEETAPENMRDAVMKKYGIDRERAEVDVTKVLQQLREIEALQE